MQFRTDPSGVCWSHTALCNQSGGCRQWTEQAVIEPFSTLQQLTIAITRMIYKQDMH